jgi:protein-tyrosine phosphatase
MAEAIATDLALGRDLDVTISSTGVLDGGRPASEGAAETMTRRGLDLSNHVSRQIDASLLEAADLIVTMERRHLLVIAELDPAALRRAFPLNELERIAASIGPRSPTETYERWIARAGDPARSPAPPSRRTEAPARRGSSTSQAPVPVPTALR